MNGAGGARAAVAMAKRPRDGALSSALQARFFCHYQVFIHRPRGIFGFWIPDIRTDPHFLTVQIGPARGGGRPRAASVDPDRAVHGSPLPTRRADASPARRASQQWRDPALGRNLDRARGQPAGRLRPPPQLDPHLLSALPDLPARGARAWEASRSGVCAWALGCAGEWRWGVEERVPWR